MCLKKIMKIALPSFGLLFGLYSGFWYFLAYSLKVAVKTAFTQVEKNFSVNSPSERPGFALKHKNLKILGFPFAPQVQILNLEIENSGSFFDIERFNIKSNLMLNSFILLQDSKINILDSNKAIVRSMEYQPVISASFAKSPLSKKFHLGQDFKEFSYKSSGFKILNAAGMVTSSKEGLVTFDAVNSNNIFSVKADVEGILDDSFKTAVNVLLTESAKDKLNVKINKYETTASNFSLSANGDLEFHMKADQTPRAPIGQAEVSVVNYKNFLDKVSLMMPAGCVKFLEEQIPEIAEKKDNNTTVVKYSRKSEADVATIGSTTYSELARKYSLYSQLYDSKEK